MAFLLALDTVSLIALAACYLILFSLFLIENRLTVLGWAEKEFALALSHLSGKLELLILGEAVLRYDLLDLCLCWLHIAVVLWALKQMAF